MIFSLILYPDFKQEITFLGYRWSYIQEYNKFIIKRIKNDNDDKIDKINYSWEYLNMASTKNILYLNSTQRLIAEKIYEYVIPIIIDIDLENINTVYKKFNEQDQYDYKLKKDTEFITRDNKIIKINIKIISKYTNYFNDKSRIILTKNEFDNFEQYFCKNHIENFYQILKILSKIEFDINNFFILYINNLIFEFDKYARDPKLSEDEDEYIKLINKETEIKKELIYIMDFIYNKLNIFNKELICAIIKKLSNQDILKEYLKNNLSKYYIINQSNVISNTK
jgi:hypothetical protein